MSGLFGKKKKPQKQSLDVNNSVPYAQTRPTVQSPVHPSPSYNSGYPGNVQYGQQHQGFSQYSQQYG